VQALPTGFKSLGNSPNEVAEVEIDALTTRRKVAAWVGMDVSYMLNSDKPALGQENGRAFCHVPVLLYSSTEGVKGQVGTVKVDALTGEFDRSKNAARALFMASCNLSGMNADDLKQALHIFEQAKP
jgi:hypothetical protein